MKITGNMWNAFVEATEEGMCFATFTKGFEAALAAAQTPPAIGEVVVTTDEFGRAVAVTRQDEDGRILSVVWEAPTPPAQEPEISLTDGYTAQVTSIKHLAGELKLQMLNDEEMPKEIEVGDLISLRNVVHLEPAQEAEPVGGVIGDDELRARWLAAGGRFHGPNVETGAMPEAKLLPFLRNLEGTAPSDELRKAAEEFIDYWDGDSDELPNRLIENLRAALEGKS